LNPSPAHPASTSIIETAPAIGLTNFGETELWRDGIMAGWNYGGVELWRGFQDMHGSLGNDTEEILIS